MSYVADQTSRDIKATVAKILASENISVVFKTVTTASFDPINRVLTIPDYKDGLSREMYDLFIGHEVGHALYTPQIAPNNICPSKANFGSFVNIVEDVRIERKIRIRFQGLIKSFFKGYAHLVDNGFFGDFTENALDTRHFADRVNIYFKLGAAASELAFVGHELEIVNQIKSADTWEEVIAAAHALYDYSQMEQQEQKEENSQQSNDTADDQDESEESAESESSEDDAMDSADDSSADDSDDDSDDDSSEETEDDDSGTGHGEEDNNEDEESEENANGNGEDSEDESDKDSEELENSDDGNATASKGGQDSDFEGNYNEFVPQIETQEAFAENSQDLMGSDDGLTPVNCYFPIPTDGAVVDYKTFYTDFMDSIPSHIKLEAEIYAAHEWKSFQLKNKSVINYMVREFEMRKSADEHKRTSVAKTGVLNMNALHKYRFTEDIFLKQSVVADGKNHGLVMFVDWSSSMASVIGNTLDQLQVLMMFCHQAQIPFEVYAFSTRYYHKNYAYNSGPLAWDYQAGDITMNDSFCLLQLGTSDAKGHKFDNMMKWLTLIKKAVSTKVSGVAWEVLRYFPQINLGNTPLQDALLVGSDVVNKFRAKNNVQIVNSVFLTDGENTGRHSVYGSETDFYGSAVYFHDRKSKKVYTIKSDYNYQHPNTELFIRRFRDLTGTNVINFHLIPKNKRTFNHALRLNHVDVGSYVDESKLWQEFLADGHSILQKSVWDQLIMIATNTLEINDEKKMDSIVAGKATKAQIRNAMLKDGQNKLASRVFMSEFAKMVA